MTPAETAKSRSDGEQKPAVPSISLPKGGGAIRGMGEKFAANPVTGTGSMSIPIATSPGRSGFGPQLSLSYDSGAGNGPFGFGWNLSLPAITRKTDKGLPQYGDAEDSDVFILSGAEDLVPLLVKNAQDEWERESLPVRTLNGLTYRVRRYRPRIEGLFARIERWTNTLDATDVFWRSISKDNVTTWYGKTASSRIADPFDQSRIFTWLICETHDDKGNVIVYGYKREDSARIFEDTLGNALVKAHERNRTTGSRLAQRYLKRIRYGHRAPYFPVLKGDAPWPEPQDAAAPNGSNSWLFEVVFDYGEHDANAPTPSETGNWPARSDPFSSYRAGFEVRTYRTCQRVLMFHHFPGEMGVGRDCLVRSMDFTYSDEVDPTYIRNPVYTFLRSVTQTGYRRNNGGYDSRSLPPVEFEYTDPIVQNTVEQVDPASLANLPVGLDGSSYRWTDLHGEGLSGILTEQAGAWFYKRNLSPIPTKLPDGSQSVKAKFAPLETVALKPNVALSGGAEFIDLAGDGQPDVVVMEGPTPGLYEHDEAEGWQQFRPFGSRLNRNLRDPNLKFIDLDGDGHADVLITENDAFVWHASLAEEGFGPARRVVKALDEEKGPRIVFADGTQSIYLADLSGDGLTDVVRIRNGEVCYWPNLGHGCFGPKVTMDNAPWFDNPDQFDQKRIRLADIDGSGTTDIIYLHRDGVRLYFNQSGNSWSKPQQLRASPRIDDVANIMPIDLLGNGMACLVWSSSLPGDARRPMRYMNLMGEQKPHLLVKSINNLGAETRVDYAPSTKSYLRDKQDGKPWITRLPFPVHVVEKVTTYDHISRNRFVTSYAYHHGYFDGEEREFRGFGMVEQWDTEQFAAFAGGNEPVDNIAAESHVPPVHTKTWFHTGVYLGWERITRQFENEYFREPGQTVDTARPLLLDDTIVQPGLTLEEEREACRALKGSMLRQEVYADDAKHPDATPEQLQRARTPYTVTEQNFSIRALQPRGPNRHAVFFTHAHEALSYHYERNPADPRIQHELTLEVDDYGNVRKSLAIGYGRRPGMSTLQGEDKVKQEQLLITYTENDVTNAIDKPIDDPNYDPDNYRTPLASESCTYEVTGFKLTDVATRFSFEDFAKDDSAALRTLPEINYEDPTDYIKKQKRLIERIRTIYCKNDLSGLLPFGKLESNALPGDSYKLAFSLSLLDEVFNRAGQKLLSPNAAAFLGGTEPDCGGYVDLDKEGHWWIPSGRIFYHPDADVANPAVSAVQELAEARGSFYLPRKYTDPFGHGSTVDYQYDLLVGETKDALGNTVRAVNDYRVLQPALVTDPNHNRTEIAFDTLGMVVGTAVMGKPAPAPVEGDTLTDFAADLTQDQLDQFMAAPRQASANPKESEPTQIARDVMQGATTRIVYDLDRFMRLGEPAFAATIARETHVSDLKQGEKSKLQISFSYSDGFGREIQKKIQAEPGPVPQRGDEGKIIIEDDGQPKMGDDSTSPRWVGSGWTIFNNKGKPVRQYEPFFTHTHHFKFEPKIGVSPVLFYDPLERVVATLHPNHTWEKVVFDPWRQETWDVNDTVVKIDPATGNVTAFDPKTDDDVGSFFARLPSADYLPTWHALRTDVTHSADFAARYPDSKDRTNETNAAEKAAAHAGTSTVAHLDTLGRTFLTVAHNKVACPGHEYNGKEEYLHTRVELDIEGNQRAVRDAVTKAFDVQDNEVEDHLGRIVMRYDYDIAGQEENEDTRNAIHQSSMEAGERWTLFDVAGKPIRAWDSRGFARRMTYDKLRRPTGLYVTENGTERLAEKTVYGEDQGDAANHRGKVYQQFDQAGIVTHESYDFKSNLLKSSRHLQPQYDQAIHWETTQPSGEIFSSSTTYDALNRPVKLITPDNSITRHSYNEANLLEGVDVALHGATSGEQPNWTHFVTNIDYDAKGQRTRIDYGNDANTFYTYDPLTFRLIHLITIRGDKSAADCSPAWDPRTREDPPAICSRLSTKKCVLQSLSYVYDPAGNITHIRDDAQQIIFFKNQCVEPSAEYTYDAFYRLIQATGREHLGQNKEPMPHSWDDHERINLPHPNDCKAMGSYTERYVYDEVGNFIKMQHRGGDPLTEWTRNYAYKETSLIEDGTGGTLRKLSNRLSSTTMGNGSLGAEIYNYDAHGNMTFMPHLPQMEWDFEDQMQWVDLGGGGTAYYVYDAGGERVRKVIECQNGSLKEECIYLGAFEIYREYNGNGSNVTLERETLHVMDDKQRIALVESKTIDTYNDPTPVQLIRYQFGNHLGSACLELDAQALIISYEEYTPYGSSSYQAVRNKLETPKRYRYTGKERDEETGFNYHGARYYVVWLGRWISCDPKNAIGFESSYCYVSNNALAFHDPDGADKQPVDNNSPSRQLHLPVGAQTLLRWHRDIGHRMPTRSSISVVAGGYHHNVRRPAGEASAYLREKVDKLGVEAAVRARKLQAAGHYDLAASQYAGAFIAAVVSTNIPRNEIGFALTAVPLGQGTAAIGARAFRLGGAALRRLGRASGRASLLSGRGTKLLSRNSEPFISSKRTVIVEDAEMASLTKEVSTSARPAPQMLNKTSPQATGLTYPIAERQALHQIGAKGPVKYNPENSPLLADPAKLRQLPGAGIHGNKINTGTLTGHVAPHPSTIKPSQGTIYFEPTTYVKVHAGKKGVHYVPVKEPQCYLPTN